MEIADDSQKPSDDYKQIKSSKEGRTLPEDYGAGILFCTEAKLKELNYRGIYGGKASQRKLSSSSISILSIHFSSISSSSSSSQSNNALYLMLKFDFLSYYIGAIGAAIGGAIGAAIGGAIGAAILLFLCLFGADIFSFFYNLEEELPKSPENKEEIEDPFFL